MGDGSPLSAIGINVVGLVAQIVNFTLLMVLLYAVLYKPVVRVLDQRAERIKEGLQQAEEAKAELDRARADYAETLARARMEAQEIIGQAIAEGERIRKEAQEAARRDADALLERAREQIERDREEASRALRAEVADLALAAAGRVVSKTFDTAEHYRLVDEVLQDLGNLDLNGHK